MIPLAKDPRVGGPSRPARDPPPTARRSLVAETLLRRSFGWDPQDARRAARALVQVPNAGSGPLFLVSLLCPSLPFWAADGKVGEIRERRTDGKHDVRWVREVIGLARADDHAALEVLCWISFVERVLRPAYGADEGILLVTELLADRRKNADGRLVSTILRARGDLRHSDYGQFLGCESYRWLAEHPQYHGFLLERAPVGSSGRGWTQTFPHEIEREQELNARGWRPRTRAGDCLWFPPPTLLLVEASGPEATLRVPHEVLPPPARRGITTPERASFST